MLERTMKPLGATAVFLAVINLLTVSSNTVNETSITSSQAPGPQDSSTALSSIPLISNSPTEPAIYQSSPKTGTSPSVITEKAANTSTPRSPIISTVSTPTEKIPRVSTSTGLNKDVNDSTLASDKASSAPPKTEDQIVGTKATTPSIHEVPSKEASTIPSGESQKPETNDENSFKGHTGTSYLIQVSSKEPSTRPSVEPQINPALNGKDITDHDNSISSGGAEKMSATSNKGIKIGAGCVAAVIAVIVLVVIYKICQKKPPAAENAEVKASAETKENVKLLSVKTETPNPDMKRASSNQMESIEC